MDCLLIQVLSKILNYLGIYDLKKSRFVAQIWNQVGLMLLRNRCRVVVGYDGSTIGDETMRLFQYSTEMKNSELKPKSLLFYLPYFECFCSGNTARTKWTQDFN